MLSFFGETTGPVVTCLTTQNSERKISQIGQKYRQNSCSRITWIGLDHTVTGKTLLQRKMAGGRNSHLLRTLGPTELQHESPKLRRSYFVIWWNKLILDFLPQTPFIFLSTRRPPATKHYTLQTSSTSSFELRAAP